MHIEKLPCNMHVHKAGIRDNEAYLSIHAHCKEHNKCTHTHMHARTCAHTHTHREKITNYNERSVSWEQRGKNEQRLTHWCSLAGHSTGKGWYILRLAGHTALFHSYWAHKYQEMTHLLIRDNEMECMAEWAQTDEWKNRPATQQEPLSCDFVPHNYETLKWLASLPAFPW